MGIRQSGIPDFRFVNMIDDIKIFVVARDDAKAILKDKNNPAHILYSHIGFSESGDYEICYFN